MRLSSRKALGIAGRSLRPGRPHHAQWFLTNRCNRQCLSCLAWRNPKPAAELPAREVIRGLDILRSLGIIEVVFSGGNPLLRDDIGEILDHASRSFVTTVYDNGSLALKKLGALRNADFVAISLDSLDEAANDRTRGTGAWRSAMEAIDGLKKEGVSVAVSVLISQANLRGIVDITKSFTDMGIPVLYCLYGSDSTVEKSLFRLGARDGDLALDDRAAAARVCDELIELKRTRPGVLITTRTLRALKKYFLTGERAWSCGALRDFLMIDPGGNVAGCHLKEPGASVFDLPGAWPTRKFRELRTESAGCETCLYLCYVFYSLHSGALGHLSVLWDRRRMIASLWRSAAKSSRR